jgi:hypothetical protein
MFMMELHIDDLIILLWYPLLNEGINKRVCNYLKRMGILIFFTHMVSERIFL